MDKEPTEQHDAATRASLHKIMVAACHLWLSNCWLRVNRLPTESTYWVYDRNLEWGQEILAGKRIRVTVEIEDWTP